MKATLILIVALALHADCVVKTIWIEGNPSTITECTH